MRSYLLFTLSIMSDLFINQVPKRCIRVKLLQNLLIMIFDLCVVFLHIFFFFLTICFNNIILVSVFFMAYIYTVGSYLFEWFNFQFALDAYSYILINSALSMSIAETCWIVYLG